MQMSLYVHFPFCKSKCVYCDFCSFTARDSEIARYIDNLTREMELAAAEFPDVEIATVYFGGGTPSVVPAPLMRKVLVKLRECFYIQPGAEFTSEANPGTIREDWLAAMAEAGMNRLSIGMQAKQDRLLKMLGRIHDYSQVKSTLELARGHGIDNLSVDLMYGLPSQTVEEYLASLRAAADLGVRHISAYALKVEEGTRLCAMIAGGEAVLPDEDETADMMEQGIALLASLGYQRYEISNFAKPGFASRHNLVYWRQGYYLGLGLNAASMLPDENAVYCRRVNTASADEYQRLLSRGGLPIGEITSVDREDAMFEMIMLGLRTTKGVRYAEFERRYGVKITDRYSGAIAELQSNGWIQSIDAADPHLALNERGLAMQNSALMLFMEET